MMFRFMNSDVTESAAFYQLVGWLDKNRTKVIGGTVVVVAVGVVVSLILWDQKQTEKEASYALAELGPRIDLGEEEELPSAQKYLDLAEEYQGTKAAARAMLIAGGALFTEENYARSQDVFEQFIANYTTSEMLPVARYGIAASLDGAEQMDRAMTEYQRISSQFPKDPVASEAKLAMARIYETRHEFPQALNIYDELTSEGTASAWSSDANRRRQRLLMQHPELEEVIEEPTPTNAVPAEESSMPLQIDPLQPVPPEGETNQSSEPAEGESSASFDLQTESSSTQTQSESQGQTTPTNEP